MIGSLDALVDVTCPSTADVIAVEVFAMHNKPRNSRRILWRVGGRRLAYYPENRGHEVPSGISLEVSSTAAAFLRCLVSITHDDTKSLCVFISFRVPPSHHFSRHFNS